MEGKGLPTPQGTLRLVTIMTLPTFTLRSSLLLTILMIGIFAVSLVLLSGYIFLNLAYESEQSALTGLMGSKVSDHILKLDAKSKDLAAAIQLDPRLRETIDRADTQSIESILDDQFNRYFVTADVIKLQKLFLLDTNYNLIASSAKGVSLSPDEIPCPALLELARNRTPAERIKPVAKACLQNNVPYYTMISSVGTFRPKAYLVVVTDPTHQLTGVESDLGLPLSITLPNDEPRYQSEHWPSPELKHHYLLVNYPYLGSDGEPIASIKVARDLREFRKSIFDTAYLVVFGFALLIGLIMFIAVLILHRATRPLRKLGTAAEQLSQGHYTEIADTSYPEIDGPIKSFNIMARKMTTLINELEKEIEGRNKVEDELREHQYQLEDTVENRTAELKMARDQALDASKAKSTFLANMSHELRTPLTAIIGYSEMLLEDAVDDGHNEYVPDLENITHAGKHLMGLINSVLDISKIEAGKMELDIEMVDIPTTIHELVATLGSLAGKAGNSMLVECPEDIGSMTTDKMKLKQILMNLLSNANKFTQNGQILLAVWRESHSGNKWINFSITDTGIGIEENTIAKLFDEFSQANPSTTRKYGGTGLGLAITLKFTEMMGGQVNVFSVPDIGSIFSVKLPEDCAHDLPMAAQESL